MKARLSIAGLMAATVVLCASSGARAAGHAHDFGQKGQLILSADRLLPVFSYTSASVTRMENNVELTDSKSGAGISLLLGRNLAIEETGLAVPVNVHTVPRVAFDVTIIPRLTLGAAIAFGFGLGGTNRDENLAAGGTVTRESDGPSATAFGLAPRVGYILPLGDLFAFWPRAGFAVYSVTASQESVDGNTLVTVRSTDTLFSIDLDPQFALVPFEHFFIHAGPIVNVPIGGTRSGSITREAPSGRTTVDSEVDASVFNLGLSAGLGGWFDVF